MMLVLQATDDQADLQRRLREVTASKVGCEVVVCSAADRELPPPLASLLAGTGDVAIGFLPYGASFSPLPLTSLHRSASIMAWPIAKPLPAHSCAEPDSTIGGWIMSADLARAVLPGLPVSRWHLTELGRVLEEHSESVNWLSSPNAAPSVALGNADRPPLLTASSRVLAVIPHFACEPWLATSLDSLVRQTRPLDGIVVVDDASAEPPVEICRRFPEVTALQSPENCGPYRLVQQVVEETGYDAYFFQDADDWSCIDRLALMLAEAERTAAALIGTQEIRLDETGAYQPASYPLDVTRASADGPQHPLLHPTSMVARALLEELGGFATGLRFSGDTEFLYRAVFVAQIVNIPDFAYVHRKRPNSLVTSPETGMQSRKRQDLLKLLHGRAGANVLARRNGRPLDLAPLSKAPPIALRHLCGPKLRARSN